MNEFLKINRQLAEEFKADNERKSILNSRANQLLERFDIYFEHILEALSELNIKAEKFNDNIEGRLFRGVVVAGQSKLPGQQSEQSITVVVDPYEEKLTYFTVTSKHGKSEEQPFDLNAFANSDDSNIKEHLFELYRCFVRAVKF